MTAGPRGSFSTSSRGAGGLRNSLPSPVTNHRPHAAGHGPGPVYCRRSPRAEAQAQLGRVLCSGPPRLPPRRRGAGVAPGAPTGRGVLPAHTVAAELASLGRKDPRWWEHATVSATPGGGDRARTRLTGGRSGRLALGEGHRPSAGVFPAGRPGRERRGCEQWWEG